MKIGWRSVSFRSEESSQGYSCHCLQLKVVNPGWNLANLVGICPVPLPVELIEHGLSHLRSVGFLDADERLTVQGWETLLSYTTLIGFLR